MIDFRENCKTNRRKDSGTSGGEHKGGYRGGQSNMTITEERRIIGAVKRLYHEGKTPEQTAKIIGHPVTQIHKWLKIIKASEKYSEK